MNWEREKCELIERIVSGSEKFIRITSNDNFAVLINNIRYAGLEESEIVINRDNINYIIVQPNSIVLYMQNNNRIEIEMIKKPVAVGAKN